MKSGVIPMKSMFEKIFRKSKKSVFTSSQEIKSPRELLDLPDELLLYIFSFASAQDLIFLSAVNKHIKSMTEDNQLWIPIAKQIGSTLKITEGGNVKEQLRQKIISEKEGRFRIFLQQENTKKAQSEFQTIESSFSKKLAKEPSTALANTLGGALWTLPIFTYGAGKMVTAEKGSGYLSGLENVIGILLLPWAIIGDIVKAPIALSYAVVNAARLAVTAPANLILGGRRDKKKEEENLYLTMRYSLFAAVDGLKRLGLEDDDSFATMCREGRLQPLMAMVCFIIAYNSLSMDKETLLLNETKITQNTCPLRFLPFFKRIIQMRDIMTSNLSDLSENEMAKLAVEWVPTIWTALKSDETCAISNGPVKEIIFKLKELMSSLMKNGVDKEASVRMIQHLG